MEDHQEEEYVLQFLEINSTSWIHTTECLQSPWSKVYGMWCIYIIHQLNKGLDLNIAIHQKLYGARKIYTRTTEKSRCGSAMTMPARVILFQNGMRRMTPPDFLLKHRIQTCKCHTYPHHLSKKICWKDVMGNHCKQ